MTTEERRLKENYSGSRNWLKWGPYLSERQWGTVREDYSPRGSAWNFFPHDHARSRAYRWGEDGLAGISDELCDLCFAVSLWNGKDTILKERLFGLSGPEGNHGEDVKELYYYLDNTPSHSYMKHLYKYPQNEFPYKDLVLTNGSRTKKEPEYELLDTGIFDNNEYFDVFTEYAKASEEDILIKITAYNRSEGSAPLSLLPVLWFRNRWSSGLVKKKPRIETVTSGETVDCVRANHPRLGDYYLYFQKPDDLLFTENETNTKRLYDHPNVCDFVKDGFHCAVVQGKVDLYKEQSEGTKFSPWYRFEVPAGGSVEVRLRLSKDPDSENPLGSSFDEVFELRKQEADEFYQTLIPEKTSDDLKNIQRQAFAGLLWTKQYYNIDINHWLDGDPGQVKPPKLRKFGRNSEWRNLNNEDIISMPDKWEYPWYAAWDLTFHCIPLARIDPDFAKNQLILFLREWYMHPNGQIPAYEWNFSDVNPPLHAWAALQIYKLDKEKTGKEDIHFLKRVFQKLLLNFTWWVNQKDVNGNNIFEGGFLGLDNIGVFDRSSNIPGGGHLEQADGTSWMAMYSLNMLEMALEIAVHDSAYEDVATKFFEHFVYIAESLNQIKHDEPGVWDEEEGFFYDLLVLPGGKHIPLKVRSLVGLTTLFAVLVLDLDKLENLKDFYSRLKWFRNYRQQNMQYMVVEDLEDDREILLSLVPRARLERLLKTLLDESEFLSSGGIRSLSKIHEKPYSVKIDKQEFGLKYEPGESSTGLFGGNSNWRGPVWFPMNYLLIQSLGEYYKYYGETLKAECPAGSEKMICLEDIATNISKRLVSLFQKDKKEGRAVHGRDEIYKNDPHFRDLILFYEYFDGDSGHGIGASHQTGWTGLVADLISRK